MVAAWSDHVATSTSAPPIWYSNFGNFDDLFLYRAVATDLETSLPVVISHGSMVKAMQALVTVPGAAARSN